MGLIPGCGSLVDRINVLSITVVLYFPRKINYVVGFNDFGACCVQIPAFSVPSAAELKAAESVAEEPPAKKQKTRKRNTKPRS